VRNTPKNKKYNTNDERNKKSTKRKHTSEVGSAGRNGSAKKLKQREKENPAKS